jgi:CBS domain-containing protein
MKRKKQPAQARIRLLGLHSAFRTPHSAFLDWVSAALQGEDDKAPGAADAIITYDLIGAAPITAFPWETCRTAAERMAQAGVGRLPVVSPDDPRKLVGMVTRSDLLKPRARHVEEEARRERFLGAGRPRE